MAGETIFPQVDYGQGSGAWVPATTGPVFQKMETARLNTAFALLFCTDILFGKERSGESCWFWVTELETYTDASGNEQTRSVIKQEKRKASDRGWLYNNNTLNASRTGVPQVFGPPAARLNGTWCYAVPCTTAKGDSPPSGVPQFTFVIENPLEGEDTRHIRLLDAGIVAFAVTDHFGTHVRVPYGANHIPVKTRRGRPEAGNSKKSPLAGIYQ